MIVTHSTGEVNEYDVPYLQEVKTRELEVLAHYQANCDCLDEYISNAIASGELPAAIG